MTIILKVIIRSCRCAIGSCAISVEADQICVRQFSCHPRANEGSDRSRYFRKRFDLNGIQTFKRLHGDKGDWWTSWSRLKYVSMNLSINDLFQSTAMRRGKTVKPATVLINANSENPKSTP